MSLNNELPVLLIAFAVGYLPGILIGLFMWLWGKRNHSMPLFFADLVSFLLPVFVWLIMHRYNLTFARQAHSEADELAVLGWIWTLCFIGRMVIPRYTHKLRFRLAAINTGTICTIAAVLLACFYQISWK